MLSCSKEHEPIEQVKSVDESLLFEQSVLIGPIIQNETGALSVELKNYNPEYTLKAAYSFNSVVFIDDGKFSDEIAGDNIYTSVKKGEIISSITHKKTEDDGWKVGKDFRYHKSLDTSKGLTISCEFRHDECPPKDERSSDIIESDWGTGWGCFYLENCTIEIEF